MLKKTIFYLFAATLSLWGCKKDEQKSEATFQLRVVNEVNGAPLTMGQILYDNAAGEPFSVNLLKYYLSHVEVKNTNGNWIKLAEHKLIDQEDSDNFMKVVLPNGTYSSLKFAIGVDAENNTSGLQEGDLDPINGMLWTWSTGYIFFKHEGEFVTSIGTVEPLYYHYGLDSSYLELELPIQLKVEGEDVSRDLVFDLGALYSAEDTISFFNNNNNQSVGPNADRWLNSMKANFAKSFEVK
jgi:hypothetical protein